MDEIDALNLEAMIEIYKKRRTNLDYITFQARLRAMKEEVEDFTKGNPRFKSMIDEIIQEIERYQTVGYVGYIRRFYERRLSEIMVMISRLKAFMST